MSKSEFEGNTAAGSVIKATANDDDPEFDKKIVNEIVMGTKDII